MIETLPAFPDRSRTRAATLPDTFRATSNVLLQHDSSGPKDGLARNDTREKGTKMTRHVAYVEHHFSTAASCVRGIRELVDLGWNVVQLRGGTNGPFLVVCRKDDHS